MSKTLTDASSPVLVTLYAAAANGSEDRRRFSIHGRQGMTWTIRPDEALIIIGVIGKELGLRILTPEQTKALAMRLSIADDATGIALKALEALATAESKLAGVLS